MGHHAQARGSLTPPPFVPPCYPIWRNMDTPLPSPFISSDDSPIARAAAMEEGRLLFARDCSFLRSVPSLEHLPADDLPEVAFAGRSNVGKSSLINALTGHGTMARASNTPGRTQQLNFFSLDGRLLLVDLPGYGYAKAPKDQVKRWTRLVNGYLKGRAALRRVCLLVDSRHGLKDSDREVMTMLDSAAVSYLIVLTKTDKISPPALDACRQAVAEEASRHVAAYPDIAVTSSEKGLGLAELRMAIAALALPAPERNPPP